MSATARRNGAAPPARAAEAYLIERGFTPDAIREVGWRIEPLGGRAGRYGLPAEARDALAWIIPYRHPNGRVRFERIRLINAADLERFGGGKYRQPKGTKLALYDPYAALEQDILEVLLVIEGEANAVAVHQVMPDLPVVALPGKSALTVEMAERIGHAHVVLVWIDRHEPGADRDLVRIRSRLRKAGTGEVCVLPATAGVDANEALREFGVEQARELFGEMIQRAAPVDETEGEPWPAVAPATLPAFPLDALPRAAADYLQALAEATETPPDLGAIAALGVLSAAGLGVRVECGPEWGEELALYLLVAMESGDRKSTVLNAVAKPLHLIQSDERKQAEAVVRERKLRRESLEARKARLVKTFANSDDPEQRAALELEMSKLAEDLDGPGDPQLPRLLADDATPETLAGLLARYGPLAIASAEAPIISNLLGRYDGAGAANLDLVCKAYEGERTQIDRRNREELLDRPLLTILLTVQPHVLRTVVEHETARRQGLVARFAFALPQSLLGRRRHHDAEIPRAKRDAWEALVRRVYSRRPLTQTTETNCVNSVSTQEVGDSILSLSPSAKTELRKLRQEQEPRLAEGADLRPISDWQIRHAGRIARIAAILHLADSDGSTIDDATIRRALRIGDYLLAHATAALTQPHELTRKALRELERRGEPTVTVRDLHRWVLNGRGNAAAAHELAERLTELGALRLSGTLDADSGPGPGRPPSPVFDVNPCLLRSGAWR